MTDRDVAVVGFAHAPHVRRTEGTTNGVEMLMPCFAELYERPGHQADRHRLLVLGLLGLPCRPGVLVRLGDRLDRRGPADQRVARRDGRRVGALRGLHQDPDRRGRHRARLRLRQVLGRRAAPGARAAARPVHGGAAVARRGVDGRPAGPASGSTPGKWTAEQMAQVALDSFAVAGTHRLATKPAKSDRRAAGPAVLRRSAAPPRHRADHRRRVGDRAGRRRPGPRAAARTRRGSPASSTASRPRCWVPAT